MNRQMNFTIVDRLHEHATQQPTATAFRFLNDHGHETGELSYLQLWQEAHSVASFLKTIATPGSRIMLFFPPGLSYITAFYGCLLAGMVAVPLYPPRRNVKSDRIIKVAQSCQAVIALTTASELTTVKAAWDEQNALGLSLDFYSTDSIAFSPDCDPDLHQDLIDIAPATPAFLQYTSGSTGTPKGVIITHENIIANVRHLSLMSSGNKDDKFVNWLPLFHDLGLITAVLWPVYLGAPSTLMAPASFVRDPVAWLKAISHYRGSMCGAPNFSYDLCVDKIADADLNGIDLSCWRVAYNAAEPVRADTLHKFSERFSSHGFTAEAFYPGYGMAEATVFITGGAAALKPLQLTVNRKALAEHRLELVDDAHSFATKIIACGSASFPHDVKIVDPQTTHALEQGKVGEIWFAGPSVSPGYWQLGELSDATFAQKIIDDQSNFAYLRTGDLGVIYRGELFVTGRIKDLIILRGRNYYPQDIELSIAKAHSAIRPGYVAAFSLVDTDLERLVVVAEIEREFFRSMKADEVVNAIRHRVALEHEVAVDQVVLLKPYKIPVTSSGKIMRRQTRQMLLDGELDMIAQSEITGLHYVAPNTATEMALCEIWRRVLKLTQLGIDDDFFEIGGDSINALEISVQVRKCFDGLELDVAQLLEFPTVAQLARQLDLKVAHAQSKKNHFPSPQNKAIRI